MSNENKKEIQPEVFPLPTDKVLLLDLDKTLIDPDYVVNDPEIFKQIARVQKSGWTIGMSSDTPLEPLQKWARFFGISGPIIAEKGSVLYVPGVGFKTLSESAPMFDKIKSTFVDLLRQKEIPMFIGDATEFIRTNQKLPNLKNGKIVAVNAYRRCSFNYFTRTIDAHGFVKKNKLFFEEVYSFSKKIWEEINLDLDVDYNPEYEILILAPKETSKKNGTQELLKTLKLRQIGVIGDSKGDIIGKDMAVHYAVGNATNDLKLVADYMAKESYAAGVVEILRAIKK